MIEHLDEEELSYNELLKNKIMEPMPHVSRSEGNEATKKYDQRVRVGAERLVLGIYRDYAEQKFLAAGGKRGLEWSKVINHEGQPIRWIAAVLEGMNNMVPFEIHALDPFMIWFDSKEKCQHAIDSLNRDEIFALRFAHPWSDEEDDQQSD